MSNCRTVMLLLVAQMAFISSVGAAPLETIVYQDGFTVDGVERQYGEILNLTTIEGSLLKWIAPGSMVFADINGEDVVYAASRNGASAVINADLSLVGGVVKVEADVMPLGNRADDTTRGDWVAIGFQPGQASTGHGGAGLWMLFRGNGGYQIFRTGTQNLLADGAIAGYVQWRFLRSTIRLFILVILRTRILWMPRNGRSSSLMMLLSGSTISRFRWRAECCPL